MTRNTEADDVSAMDDSAESEGRAVASDLSALETELERVRADANEAADRALRTVAEFDNYRRRSEREKRDASETGAASVLRELLDVADNFDRALASAGADVSPAFLEGLTMTARGLHDLLDRRGVKRIETVGVPFDPHVHEAIASEASADVEAGFVLRDVQPGWAIGTRVLRPAKVVVARAMPDEEN